MDVENLAKELILKNMTPEQQMAVLDSVRQSVSQAKEVQKRKIGENVDLVVQALKKIETDITTRFESVGNSIEKRVLSIKDGRDGSNGRDGRDGKDGKSGKDGLKGDRGADGQAGRDGIDGVDGVSVVNANIDFDGSLIISLSDGRVINVGEVVSQDIAEKIKVISTMSTNAAVGIKDEGSSISTGVKTINFVGAAVTASASGDDVTVNVSSGTGTVTSVALSGGTTGLTTSGSPITTTGTITLGGTLAVASGGTGTATPSLVAGTNITSITGSWPNQTINASGGSGTVTSVAATGGTGISVSGSPITTSGTLTITNTAPDQTVVLTAGTGITTSGTYPNFTITNSGVTSAVAGTGISVSGATGAVTITNSAPDQTVALTAGTGISTSGTYPNFTITNSAPDKTVTLTGAGTTSISGTYPNFTVTSNDAFIGTVTSVTGTSPVASSGGATPAISLASGYGDTLNPYASKTANFVLAAPNGSAGVPTFRAVVAADIPTLNQNTTGTASNVTGTVAVANGGTGQTSYTNGQLLIGNTTGNTLTKATLTAGTGIAITNGTGSISIASTATGTVTSVSGTGTASGLTLSGTVTTSGNLTLSGTATVDSLTTASGSAPSYSARAWVNFNGTGTVAIRASGNVSSITDNGTGNYTINFTTAMTDVNYATVGAAWYPSAALMDFTGNSTGTYSTSAVQIFTINNANSALVDSPTVNVIIIR